MTGITQTLPKEHMEEVKIQPEKKEFSERVKRFLEQEAFVDANIDESLSDEDKESALKYEDLTEEEKEELNELMKTQMEKNAGSTKYQYLKAPRTPRTQKQIKAVKKRRRVSNASRKANQKKAKKR